MKKVAVIGAGVSGLGSAIRIKEKFPDFEVWKTILFIRYVIQISIKFYRIQVSIISKKLTPNTTGDGSAGLWGPFILGDTPDDKVV